jgi:hypothetical protein
MYTCSMLFNAVFNFSLYREMKHLKSVCVYNIRMMSSSSNFSPLNEMEIEILQVFTVIYKYLISVFIMLRSKMQWAAYTYHIVFHNAHVLEILNFKG